MQRVEDYCPLLAWSSGLGYVALWAMSLWTLDSGTRVFGRSGVCRPDVGSELFYWVCDPASPIAILAAMANAALTLTVWAPVFVAAATVRPEAILIAGPTVAVHAVGLPCVFFVMIRLMLAALSIPRWLIRGRAQSPEAEAGASRDDAGASRDLTFKPKPLPEMPAPPEETPLLLQEMPAPPRTNPWPQQSIGPRPTFGRRRPKG